MEKEEWGRRSWGKRSWGGTLGCYGRIRVSLWMRVGEEGERRMWERERGSSTWVLKHGFADKN